MSRVCSYEMLNGKPCGEAIFKDKEGKSDQDGYCIFHSKNLEEKKDKFDLEFKRKFEEYDQDPNQVYDFSGYIFPNSINLSDYKKVFEKSVIFDNSYFCGNKNNFSSLKFEGKLTTFIGAKLKGDITDFSHTSFKGESVSFSYLEIESKNLSFFYSKFFSKITDFMNLKFNGEKIDFSKSRFEGKDIGFNDSEITANIILFDKTKFINKKGIVKFKNVKFEANEDRGISFNGAKFINHRVLFDRPEIKGTVFNFSIIHSEVDFFSFNETKFCSKKSTFLGAKFLKGAVNFNSSTFSREEIQFNKAIFDGTRVEFRSTSFLSKKTDFTGVQFLSGLTDFNNAQFKGKEIVLYNAYFYNVEKLFDFGILKIKNIFKKSKYKISDFKFFLSEKSSARYPILARKTKDDWYLKRYKEDHRIKHFLWQLLADCGRSMKRWFFWSMLLAFGFAYKYFLLGPNAFKIYGNLKFSFETMLYYSVVTFTTLGFGDITPQTVNATRWVMAEVFLGYIMFGGLISILAVKLARRS